jgi:RHS repeat-associated protein
MPRIPDTVNVLLRHFLASIGLAAALWGGLSAQSESQENRTASNAALPAVRVNRTKPVVTPPPSRPELSGVPTDAEILRARVLPEPIVPIGPSSPGENAALGAALRAYFDRPALNTLGPIARFMETHPDSVWHPSLLVNAGLVLLRQGFFSRAALDFRAAWNLSKDGSTPGARAVADLAMGQLLVLESRLGHADVVEQLLAEVGSRPLAGAATEHLSHAKQSLWVMQNAPDEAFRCGPYAVAHLIQAAQRESAIRTKILMTRAGPRGMSLAQLIELAKMQNFNAQAIVRERGDAFAIPSVIHFKAGHFAALVRREGQRYLLRDGSLGPELWVTAMALQEEASGAALVPAGQIPDGWRPMRSVETESTWGRGYATGPPPPPDGPDPTTPPCPCGGPKGMATYSAHLLQVSLNVSDKPVGYTPSLGSAVEFTAVYNQRESNQPQTFTYSNLGPKWTTEWLSYVTDDPSNASAAVAVFRRGGGEEQHTGFDSGTGKFAQHSRNRTLLTRTSASPIRYERLLPNGSKEIFAQVDGAAAYPRRVFMTESIDAQGDALSFTYDSQLRLVSLTDALGQVTTLAYDWPQDPWKITQVTDPFGRIATLRYDSSGRLERITDVIALWSAFTYAADGFMTSLTTPYGSSRFVASDDGFNRTLEMTDPMGGRERLEYRASEATMSAQDPAGTVPTIAGYAFSNDFLQYRNTFYWDRKAMAVGAGDRTKAHLYHWLHLRGDINRTVAILESEKAPLESRVWYLYPNQAGPIWEGDGRSPSVTARVLDDGTTQAFKAEYNGQGHPTKRVDPLGRETVFEYAANGIDLVTVKQKNGTGFDTLETRTYNGRHEPLTVSDASGQMTTYLYNAAGQIESVTNAKNETTTYSYNATKQLTGISGPVPGATTTFTYDGYNRIRTTTDADSYTITLDYDALDRRTQTTFPDGTTELTQYHLLDAARSKDRSGRWTTFTYDAMRRQTSVRDPAGRVIHQEWCTCGSLNALKDGKGNKTTWERDVQGRMLKEVRPDGSFTSYVYETKASRLKKTTDAKLQDTNYTYFVDNNLQQTTFTNAVIPTAAVNFTYDAVYARVATMSDGTGTTAYGYHPVTTPATLGATRLASVDGPLANDTVTYQYDQLGRITGRAVNGTANTVTWTFDALGRTLSEVNLLGAFAYTYDGATGRMSTVAYPNNQTTAYNYLGNADDRRLQAIHHKYPNGSTLSRFDYVYSATGQILTWRQQADATAVLWRYAYDASEQLTGAVKESTDPTPTVLRRHHYAYDAAGNRTVEQIDDALMGATYDNMNRIATQQPYGALRLEGTVNEPATVTVGGKPLDVSATNRFSGFTTTGTGTTTVSVTATDSSGNSATRTYEVDSVGTGKTFTFDANGNMLSDGTRTFEWNARDELVSVTSGTHRTEFAYDGLQRRVKESEREAGVEQSNSSVVWCGSEICEKRVTASNAVLERYFDRGLERSGNAFFYTRDHLSSVVTLTDSSGTRRALYDYSPSGQVAKVSGDLDSPVGYTGYRASTPGLWLSLYRAYEPNAGRWLSEDPIREAGGMNRFAYVLNNPINAIDPLGLFCVPARFPISPWFITGPVQRTYGDWTYITYNRDSGAKGSRFPGGWASVLNCHFSRPMVKTTTLTQNVAVLWSCLDRCGNPYFYTTFEIRTKTEKEYGRDSGGTYKILWAGIAPVEGFAGWCRANPPPR